MVGDMYKRRFNFVSIITITNLNLSKGLKCDDRLLRTKHVHLILNTLYLNIKLQVITVGLYGENMLLSVIKLANAWYWTIALLFTAKLWRERPGFLKMVTRKNIWNVTNFTFKVLCYRFWSADYNFLFSNIKLDTTLE